MKREEQLKRSRNKFQEVQNKRKLFFENKVHNNFRLGIITPQEGSKSFSVLQQDTGSTDSKIIEPRNKKNESHSRN